MQNAVAMDAIGQCMCDTNDFHCILQSMNKDAQWLNGKAWKTWKIIQEYYQSKDDASARDLLSALQKIKLQKNANLMKILADISAVEVRFKKALSEERKIEVVHGCAGSDYAQVIVIADEIAQIKLCSA
jgi:hypothetical protein